MAKTGHVRAGVRDGGMQVFGGSAGGGCLSGVLLRLPQRCDGLRR